jgi:hypothetical protein
MFKGPVASSNQAARSTIPCLRKESTQTGQYARDDSILF